MKYANDLSDFTDIKPGTVLAEWFEGGVKAVILRGPAAMCAYLGVPSDHPLAGHGYDMVPLDCHGGLTFAGNDIDAMPEGYYFYGWDYAHAGDKTNFGRDISGADFPGDKAWTLGEVKQEVRMAVYDFKHFIELAEAIAKK